MDDKNVIASGVSGNELAQALSELVAERWDNWDISGSLVYLVDICDKNLLPYLADQFDVEGVRGFDIVKTEEQQRELIKLSIALHKFIGTPWAIREACRTVGFPVIILEEGIKESFNAPESPDDWARFRVLVEANPDRSITATEARKLRQFVETYKNIRSHLVELGFYETISDGPIFRNNTENRDALAVSWIIINPYEIILNPRGDEVKIPVTASGDWIVPQDVCPWEDGSGDNITVSFSCIAGTGEVRITSDANITGNREKNIVIQNTKGTQLGYIRVKQWDRWRNAYSRAYNRAYNLYPQSFNAYSSAYSRAYNTDAYLKVSRKNIFIPEAGGSESIRVYSNKRWKVKQNKEL